MVNIGKKIRELRRGRGMTQETLAEAMGVSFQAVSKWENASAMPDLELVPALASFFGVSTDELLDYDRYKNDRLVEETVTRAAEIRGERPGEAEAILREGLRKFPGNEILLNNLLYTLDPAERSGEMVKICKSLIESATYDDVRYDAMRILAEIYAAQGSPGLCEETLERIPEIYFTKLELVAELLHGEKSLRAARSQFFLSLDSAASMASLAARALREMDAAPRALPWDTAAARARELSDWAWEAVGHD